MERDLVVVTGASRGIGEAIANRFAGPATTVGLIARSADDLERVAEDIRRRQSEADAVPADVTDLEAMQQALDALRDRHGPIRAFVSNAGGNPYFKPALEIQPDEWDEVMDLNLRASFFAATAAARAMVEDGVSGAIVNVASVGAQVAVPYTVPYGASKAALVHATRGLALELAPYAIRVNAVAPGYAATDLTAALTSRPERRKTMEAAIPLGRLAEPAEIAESVAFLAAASYVTGAVLTVDGGYALPPQWPTVPPR